MSHHHRLLVGSALVAVILCACRPASPPQADMDTEHAASAHPADSAHATEDAHALPRPPIEPWPSDTPLRTSMEGIADAVNQADRALASGQFDTASATTLAASVDERMQYMFAHCKLPPDADAALHALLTRQSEAAHGVPVDHSTVGLDAMREVLAQYPDYFDHLDWKPVNALI
ncbi:MAG: hypothetical protein Q4G62_04830 [Pseudomonadota bacterium]|nr:hypothetical protein [Pseudomonadota bacterium]